jgi:GDPmannose 4,6-dehydratase
MLQQPAPDDYVIATGETHTVRDFAQAAFEAIGIHLEWSGRGVNEAGVDGKTGRRVARVDPELFRPADADHLVGDYSKARQTLGWSPKTKFNDLVRLMVEHDLALVSEERSAGHA